MVVEAVSAGSGDSLAESIYDNTSATWAEAAQVADVIANIKRYIRSTFMRLEEVVGFGRVYRPIVPDYLFFAFSSMGWRKRIHAAQATKARNVKPTSIRALRGLAALTGTVAGVMMA